MKKIINAFLLLAVIYSIDIYAKDSYNIKVKINGIKDTVCYLGNYYGDKQYIKDTARVNSIGEVVFKGEESLPGGIYLIVLPSKKYFEVIINDKQVFSMETDTSDLIKKMQIKGSPENVLFYNYLNFINQKQKEVMPLRDALKAAKNNKDSTKLLQDKINKINEDVKNYKLKLIADNPNTLLAKVHKSSQDPDIPEAPLLANGKKDSTFAYRYYKAHYWDNIDFSDDRILRTPVFHNKLEQYITNMISPHPDSIMKEVDALVEKARANKEMFKYVLWYLTRNYETSKVMGYDAVFVHLVERYYMTNQAYWVNPTVLENISKRAKILGPILIGKQAPNLIMLDTNNVPVSLHHINAKFTLIFFWDPECGHCVKEMPKVQKFYNDFKDKYNIEVFAVCTDTSLVKWKSYIKKNNLNWINVDGPRALTKDFHDLYDIYSTPVLFLLNDKKEIIAKRLAADQLEGFIENYVKQGTHKVIPIQEEE